MNTTTPDSPGNYSGVTPTERYLAHLCRHSFLSLWSFSNLYTDEGRKANKGYGKELCDLLVIFENDIFLFSDKNIAFGSSGEIGVDWGRWYKRAVLKSAYQLYGAESWIKAYPDRIFLSPDCSKKFPISFPSPDKAKFHRIAVAKGAYNACRYYFGERSLGSLIIKSDLIGNAHLTTPFTIGCVLPGRGYIHVLDELTLDVVLRERDTIVDFKEYLEAKEKLLTNNQKVILAHGEEQLLAFYLKNTDKEGRHFFDIPEENDFILINEGIWEDFIQHKQYKAKVEANKVSYSWDRLIEQFIKHGQTQHLDGSSAGETERESTLRLMARETRLRRRQLGAAFVDLLRRTPTNKRATRVFLSNDFDNVAYVFLLLPRRDGENYEEYRKLRRAMLLAYCKVAKLFAPKAEYIIGIATETHGSNGSSEDLFTLKTEPWTVEMKEEAERLQKEYSLLAKETVKWKQGRTQEYPDLEDTDKNSRRSNVKKRRKNKRRVQKASRKRNRN